MRCARSPVAPNTTNRSAWFAVEIMALSGGVRRQGVYTQ